MEQSDQSISPPSGEALIPAQQAAGYDPAGCAGYAEFTGAAGDCQTTQTHHTWITPRHHCTVVLIR